MQRIRTATKNRRGILTVVVILLTIGLVGSFAVWGAGDYNASSQSGVNIDDQIKAQQDYLTGLETESAGELTYENANSLASGYQYLYQLNAQAAADVTDSAAANNYQVAAQVAATLAAQYFQSAYSLVPESLNDVGKARILANTASMLYYSGDSAGADSMFAQAMALAPEDFDLASAYASMVYTNNGLQATVDYLNSYIDGLSMGSANKAQAESLISQYQKLDSFQSAVNGQ